MPSFAIVPAAGRSRRMGQPKLLLPFGRSTVIETVLDRWQRSPVDRIVVIVRRDDEPTAQRCRARGVHVVQPGEDPPEMKDSVREGLRYVQQKFSPEESDAWLLAPADLPQLSPGVVAQLLRSYAARQAPVIVPVHGRRRGHPVLFAWEMAARVEQLGPTEGVNALLDRQEVCELMAGEACLAADLDTPEQYQRHSRRW